MDQGSSIVATAVQVDGKEGQKTCRTRSSKQFCARQCQQILVRPISKSSWPNLPCVILVCILRWGCTSSATLLVISVCPLLSFPTGASPVNDGVLPPSSSKSCHPWLLNNPIFPTPPLVLIAALLPCARHMSALPLGNGTKQKCWKTIGQGGFLEMIVEQKQLR